MVDNGLVKVIDLLLKGNLKDQDVIDDIIYVGDILEKNMKILTYLLVIYDIDPSRSMSRSCRRNTYYGVRCIVRSSGRRMLRSSRITISY